MAASPVGFTSPSLDSGHCTANDIRIATADVLEYSFDGVNFITFDPNTPISCNENDPIFLNIQAHVLETATSQRTDIGVWIAQDGGNARTGLCNHYNLVNGVAGVSNLDDDSCGDMENANEVLVPLGVIDAVCQTSATSADSLHIGSCLGWTQPGGDATCPLPGYAGPTGFRYATVPGTSSKCNCEGFNVPITVKKFAQIQINKVCDPTSDPGTFDLNIDGSTSDTDGTFGDNKTCGTNTGLRTVSAGTNTNPGATHSISEDDFTTASYNSSYACTKNGNAYISSTSGTGPFDVDVDPNDVVICTFTNVRQGKLTIIKDAVPNDLQDFSFTTTGGAPLANFSLDDDAGVTGGDNTLLNTKVFDNVPPGNYTVTEGADPTGWGFTSLSCTGAGASTSGKVATIAMPAGGDITCTYTNTKKGSITIIKDAVPNALQDFSFTTTGGAPLANFSLDDDAGVTGGDNTLLNSKQFLNVPPGTEFTITEGADPTGWEFTSLSCTGTGSSTSGKVATITLPAAGSVTCTYTNSKQGKLTIIKDAVPNDLQDFSFTTTGGAPFANFSLDDDAGVTGGDNTLLNTKVIDHIPLSTAFSVTEGTDPTGWEFTSLSCTGTGASSSGRTINVNMSAGDEATCTYTNSKQGKLTIIKDAVPNDLQDFAYTTTGGAPFANFSLDDDAGVTGGDNTLLNTKVIDNIPLSTAFSVAEGTDPTGWEFTSLNCTGTGASPSGRTINVNMSAGNEATCTYTNSKQGKLTIIKDAVPNDLQDFAYTTTGGTPFANFSLDDDAGVTGGDNTLLNTKVIDNIPLSTAFSVTEGTDPTGWQFTSLTCTGTGASSSGRTINVSMSAGDEATCTYVNTKAARLTLAKTCVGGTGTSFNFTWTALGVAQTPVYRDCGQSSVLVDYTQNFGQYVVTESATLGWDLTDIACSNGGGNTTTSKATRTATVGLDAGEDVTCTFTNTANQQDGRMTGGGGTIMVGNVKISQGLTIHCDILLSNNIEINWGKNNWHIDKPITTASCFDNPNLDQEPPAAPFDTFVGTATGTLNGVDGSYLEFTFVDAGEPGKQDQVALKIWLPGANPSVDTPFLNMPLTYLKNGNLQAHYDQPHK